MSNNSDARLYAPLRVLIVEDSEDDARLAVRELRRGGYEPEWRRVETPENMEAALREQAWDVILADYKMPRFSAPSALKLLQDMGRDLPFIVISGKVGEDVAVEVMKAGAHDFFAKDSLIRLVPSIQREVAEAENRRRRREAERDRDRALERESHLNALLRSIRDVNQIITHEKDRDALLRRTCEILISTRCYSSAWVALCGEDGKAQTVAESGIGAAFAPVREALARGDWPACYRQARERPEDIAPIHDTDRNCGTCSIAHTYRDTAVLAGALRHGGRDYGALVVALPVGLADDPEELSLFRELVGDVAYALHAMELTQERERADEALRESEQRFMDVLHRSDDAILLIGNNTFIECNEATARMLGYATRQEFLLTHPSVLSPPEQPDGRSSFEKAEEMMRLAFERGFHRFEWMHRRADGQDFPVEVSLTPLVYKGEQLLHCVWRDITQQRSLEAQFTQAQKMESVGRLAGGVAHDFNNMLSVILGYGEILFHKLHPGDPLRDDVKEIVEAGRRSAVLTRQLLAFSRKQTLQPEVLDLNAEVRDLEKMLRRLIGEDIELELALSDEIDRVMADPGQIEQVIMNLSVNARDAMPKGGKLLFETANVEIDETYARKYISAHPGKYVMLAVTDTGRGMDKETLARLFEPFFTTKEKGKGTGLGLSTVYGIVKQSGGNIFAYSEPGRGTTFKIYLPQTEAEQEPKTGAVEKETSKGGGEHILVVEDDGSLRKLMEAMLSRLGYKVSVAANGGEALLLMEEKGLKPDLVITDVVMPNMSGIELVARLQRNQPDLKVLYMSGYTDNAIVHHGVLQPGTAFIQKPFTLRGIAEKVQEVLRGA